MDINDILAELERNRGYFPEEAVAAAIERKEEMTPHLLRAIEEAVEHPEEVAGDGDRFLHLYAMYILARFREHRAYPLIIRMCRLPRDTLNDLIGDTITEGLPRILASVCAGETSSIKAIIEDPSLDEFVRGSALCSLSILVHEGNLARSDVVDYFAELFRGRLEKEHSHVWDVLASEAVDLYAQTLVDDIHSAYEEELLWPGFMHPGEVDDIFAMSEEMVLARSKQHCRGLIDDVASELRWWACFEPEQSDRMEAGEQIQMPTGPCVPGTVVRKAPKIGRNEPCPCGSGKKYKKCCGVG